MPNKAYVRGRNKEYRLKRKLEKRGWLVLRTAGSHGPFDLIAIWQGAGLPPNFNEIITRKTGILRLIQVKGGKSAEREKSKALKEIKEFDGLYSVTSEVM